MPHSQDQNRAYIQKSHFSLTLPKASLYAANYCQKAWVHVFYSHNLEKELHSGSFPSNWYIK